MDEFENLTQELILTSMAVVCQDYDRELQAKVQKDKAALLTAIRKVVEERDRLKADLETIRIDHQNCIEAMEKVCKHYG